MTLHNELKALAGCTNDILHDATLLAARPDLPLGISVSLDIAKAYLGHAISMFNKAAEAAKKQDTTPCRARVCWNSCSGVRVCTEYEPERIAIGLLGELNRDHLCCYHWLEYEGSAK